MLFRRPSIGRPPCWRGDVPSICSELLVLLCCSGCTGVSLAAGPSILLARGVQLCWLVTIFISAAGLSQAGRLALPSAHPYVITLPGPGLSRDSYVLRKAALSVQGQSKWQTPSKATIWDADYSLATGTAASEGRTTFRRLRPNPTRPRRLLRKAVTGLYSVIPAQGRRASSSTALRSLAMGKTRCDALYGFDPADSGPLGLHRITSPP